MLDTTVLPAILPALQAATSAIDFPMASDLLTGSLLRTLAATKPGGRLLELGTGTGIGSAWLLDGMDPTARLTTVDINEHFSSVARRYLAQDARVTFILADAIAFIQDQQPATFDMIFADSQPGKFQLLDQTLHLLKPGGLYIIDDLLPQPNWPANHQNAVDRLLAELDSRADLHLTKMNWSTGLIVAVKKRL